jgi:hypothetical protein
MGRPIGGHVHAAAGLDVPDDRRCSENRSDCISIGNGLARQPIRPEPARSSATARSGELQPFCERRSGAGKRWERSMTIPLGHHSLLKLQDFTPEAIGEAVMVAAMAD